MHNIAQALGKRLVTQNVTLFYRTNINLNCLSFTDAKELIIPPDRFKLKKETRNMDDLYDVEYVISTSRTHRYEMNGMTLASAILSHSKTNIERICVPREKRGSKIMTHTLRDIGQPKARTNLRCADNTWLVRADIRTEDVRYHVYAFNGVTRNTLSNSSYVNKPPAPYPPVASHSSIHSSREFVLRSRWVPGIRRVFVPHRRIRFNEHEAGIVPFVRKKRKEKRGRKCAFWPKDPFALRDFTKEEAFSL